MSRKTKTRKTRDAVIILKNRLFKDVPDIDREIKRGVDELNIAQQVYDLREQAGLTQKELADLIGTTQSVISCLEDAEYKGHSLTMLRRIADALDLHMQIRFYPREKTGS